jgi:hypothetical protein
MNILSGSQMKRYLVHTTTMEQLLISVFQNYLEILLHFFQLTCNNFIG